jgi:hypothetical protein
MYGGTGFFVYVRSEIEPGTFYGYFVTAKHNVVNAQKYGDLYIRLNKRSGGVEHIKIATEWVYPKDPSVDLAILPWSPPHDVIEMKYVPDTMIASDETLQQHSVGIGDDIIIAGLFTRRYGQQQNIPIVRFGNIAAMPGEPLPDSKTGLSYHGYLIEARSIGGLSGSPVFAHLGPTRVGTDGRLNFSQNKTILLGVIRGHWDHQESIAGVDFAGDELRQVNMGIAVATPAQEIRKIILGDEWVKKRKVADIERIANKNAKNAITEDSAFSSEAQKQKPFTKEDFERALNKATRKVEPQ